MALLAGRTALVTGGGRGIGAAVARLFASEGARVAVHANASADAAERLAGEIGGTAYRADLTDRGQAEALVSSVASDFGGLDILINTASTFTFGKRFADDSWESYLAEMEGVLGVTFHVTRAAAPFLIESGRGRIVNFGATLLWRPAAGYGPHITAKAAIVGLTRALARELGPSGVTVNIVHPGMTLTEYSLSLPDADRQRIAARTPLKRLAEPEDAARAALIFASDLAGFVTGAGLAPDGGLAVI